MSELLLCVTFDIPEAGVAAFGDYEARVLPLLLEHGGRLQRRVQSLDSCFEMHLVQFGSRESFERYRQDPRRAALSPLLATSGAVAKLTEVRDVS